MKSLALKIANAWGVGIFRVLIGIGMLFLMGEYIFKDVFGKPSDMSEPVKLAFSATLWVFVVIPSFIVGQVAVPFFLLLKTHIVQFIWVVGGAGFVTVVAAQAVRVLFGPFGQKTETAYWWATAFFGVILPCALLSLLLTAMNMPMPIFLLSS